MCFTGSCMYLLHLLTARAATRMLLICTCCHVYCFLLTYAPPPQPRDLLLQCCWSPIAGNVTSQHLLSTLDRIPFVTRHWQWIKALNLHRKGTESSTPLGAKELHGGVVSFLWVTKERNCSQLLSLVRTAQLKKIKAFVFFIDVKGLGRQSDQRSGK